jgi:V8-like Glu-specific endopeptidase
MTVTAPNNFTTFPLNAVVAVDIYFRLERDDSTGFLGNFEGSGITIAPNYVLTAGHNVYNGRNKELAFALRTTTSENQLDLDTRNILLSTKPNNVLEPYFFPKRYNEFDVFDVARVEADIALLKTEDPLIAAGKTIGLLAFVKPGTAQNSRIVTAGYPSENTTFDGRPLGRSLVLSPGADTGNIDIAQNNGRFFYSGNIQTEEGQSGSGVWSALEGDEDPQVLEAPRLLGVHTRGSVTTTDSDGVSSTTNSNGVLLTTAVYDIIVNQIDKDTGGADASILPENALVGSDDSDNIFGSYRKERILGGDGNDRLFGGGANDRLEGGTGIDQALFSDAFTSYDYTTPTPENKFFEFNHVRGTQVDGKDTTKEIEFAVFGYSGAKNNKVDQDGNLIVVDDDNLFYVPLQVDPTNPNKIKDGPEINPNQDILDSRGGKIGNITVNSPAWTFDGDANYNLTLAKTNTAFNFAYLIDTSNSMAGASLDLAKNAATNLTQSLFDQGIAANSTFAVIPFNSTATLNTPVDASATISAIDSLTASGKSNFVPALNQAQQFFQSRTNNATNIAYVLSDGFATGANEDLQSFAEVRAFGIGRAAIDSLNIIDSGDAKVLSNPADLATQFNATNTTLDRNKIASINVRLGDEVVATIAPDQLETDTQGNLTYDGSLTSLKVGRNVSNQVSFDLEFNDGTPTTSLQYVITSGQEEIRTQSADGTREVITFSVIQSDFTEAGPAESAAGKIADREITSSELADTITANSSLTESAAGKITDRDITGNELANTITVNSGKNTLQGDLGDDLFILNGGTNTVDGGEGIDTVRLNKTQVTAGAITKNDNTIKIGTDTTLRNVEFIEFSDARLSADNQTVIPIISLQSQVITVPEGNEGSTPATFTVNLSSPSTQDVVIDYATRSRNAIAGKEFTANTGKLIIAAGQTTCTISVDILGNTQATGDKQLFLDLSTNSAATFAKGKTKDTAEINIQDNDTAIGISLTADRTSFVEGNPNRPATISVTIDRFGNLSDSDTIEYQLTPVGDQPVNAEDFVNGFTPGQITFSPGEDSKLLEIPISPDVDVEGDESFALQLTNIKGTATVPPKGLQLSITDDDGSETSLPTINGAEGDDLLQGTPQDDVINGLAGNDTLYGGVGNDVITGGDGNDGIYGSEGNDLFTGNAGSDTFYFDQDLNRGIDAISDFTLEEDLIGLSKSVFTALQSSVGGGFDSLDDFATVTDDAAAASSSAFIVYNTTNGKLFYNQDATADTFGDVDSWLL